MEKLKTVIIYVLSVVLAFMAGLLIFIFSIFGALAEERKTTDWRRRDRVSYRRYTDRP